MQCNTLDVVPLELGTKLGPYEVTAPIGAGGMGEVYRARDIKLNRDVALKVLPDAFVTDPERLARFQREAEVLASLNHPNIAHIYGLEDTGDTTALVLELVEGSTLAERIAGSAIPLDEALDIANQIADALEAAHAVGIIHRDLKPANIKITPDGVVKVLDFGLAKAFTAGESGSPESSLSPTLTKGTALGVILGTAAYMSPEQAKGKPVDTRTDVWAFGAVLYEMLAGERAFKGEDVSDTLVSVFRDDPDWAELPDGTPARITQAMRVCLNKNAKQRVRDIAAVRLAMSGAFETAVTPSSPGDTVAQRRSVLPWVAACVLAAAVVALAVWNVRPVETKPVVRFAHVLPEEQAFTNTSGRPLFAIAPDGRRLVYCGDGQLFVRKLDESAAQPIPGTDRAAYPFFSHDGQWIGFWVDERLMKVPVGGGAPVRLTDDIELPRGVDWGADDTIVIADSRGLARLPAGGGTSEVLDASDALRAPQMLAGGQVLLEVGAGQPQIAVQSLDTGERRVLFAGTRPFYVPTGHIVFQQDGSIWGVGFDADRLEVIGSRVALVDGIHVSSTNLPQFDLSHTGTLVYRRGATDSRRERVLGLASRNGVIEYLDVPPAEYLSPRVSPDGRRLAVQSLNAEGAGTLWVYELSGEHAIQQFTLEADNRRPVWTPDGERIAFTSDRGGTMSIYWRPSDGSRVAERLTTAEDGVSHFPSSWTPDGKTLLYMAHRDPNLQTEWSVWTLSVDDGATESLLEAADAVRQAPALSRDGRWLAYTAGERANSQDVYVEPFPPTGARRRISQRGGNWPVWSPAGDELFYRPVNTVRERVLNHVDIVTAPEFAFSNERTLPIEDFTIVGFHRDYDVTPDGEKLLMVFPADRGESNPRPAQSIQIVLNWFSTLR